MAVKQVRVSDLSGKQGEDEDFGRLIVHEHPQYQGPITLDVLADEIGELPESEQYVSVEVIQPGERSGQRALLSLGHFNRLASTGDMNTILMNAVAEQRAPEAPRRRRGRPPKGEARPRRATGKINYATLEHAGEPHRGRITEAEKELVRNNLDKINRRLREAGMREIDPNDPTMRERYGL